MKICPKCTLIHMLPGIFCSRSCANSRGPRSEETKRKQSESLKVSEKAKFAQLNRIKITKKIKKVNKECLYCKTLTHNRNFCSQICYKKYKRSINTAFKNYRLNCNFIFNTYNYPKEFNHNLVEQYGWYSASNRGNNLGGVSRDHIISVSYGFENKIDSKIIAHPANCSLILHSENNRKNTICGLTLNELIDKIEKWNRKYEGFESHRGLLNTY